MSAVIVRIVLRYAAGLLVAKGLVSTDIIDGVVGDPDVIQAVTLVTGVAVGVVAEAWYFLARKFGWSK